MATINFYLDKPNRKNERPILLTFLHEGRKVRFSTRIKTTDKDWNVKDQKIKRNGKGESEINFALDEFKRIVNKAILDASNDKEELTLEYIKKRLEKDSGREASKKNEFFTAFDVYIEEAEINKSEGIRKIYEGTLRRLIEFERAKKYRLSFGTIDKSFESKFTEYLITECNLVNNTVGRYMKTLKSFMNFATERGYTNNNVFKSFKVMRQDADIIYLTEDELFKIFNLEHLPKRLDQVRDAFCFSCFTGLRFSDLSKLKSSDIKGDFIVMKSQKTKDTLRVPLSSFAKQILHKYEGQPPMTISNQKMNDYIKEIGQLAQVDSVETLTRYVGSKKVEEQKPKYQFLSSHTARRTFVTLSLEKGMRAEVVMAITGHKEYATFKKYIKLTENVKLDELNSVWG